MSTYRCRTLGCRRLRSRRFAVCGQCRSAINRELAR